MTAARKSKPTRAARREAAADRYAERTMPRDIEGDVFDEAAALGVGATDAETVERVLSGRVRATDWGTA